MLDPGTQAIDTDALMHPADSDEERGRKLVRAASAGVRAPLGLRERLSAPAPARRTRRTPALLRRLVFPAALAPATLAVLLAAGAPGRPTLAQAEALAASVRTDEPVGGPPSALGVRLPAELQGWRAVRRGAGTAGGRTVAVVSYRTPAGADVRYGVVGGAPLPLPAGRTVPGARTRVVVAAVNGRTAVTWRQAGRTCVLTVARGRVPLAKLVAAVQRA